jgi:protein involved in polysaccharide export with SLBB domain
MFNIDDHQPAEQRLEDMTRTLHNLIAQAGPLSHSAEQARRQLNTFESGGHLTVEERLEGIRRITREFRAGRLFDNSHHHPGDRKPKRGTSA